MRYLALAPASLLLLLFAGCDDLPAYDDPRNALACVGTSLECELRSEEGCGLGEGCNLTDGCQHLYRNFCASSSSDQTCAGFCTWRGTWCEIGPSSCDNVDDAQACEEDPAGECVWGPLCTGTPDPCSAVDNPDDCDDIPGCDWARR
jgi:hypothetical protein